jgi:hypothetical protein
MWLLERARVEAGLAHVVSSRPSRTMVRNRHLAIPHVRLWARQVPNLRPTPSRLTGRSYAWAGKVAMSRPDWAVLVSGKN